jgi:flagellar motor component MotA
MTKLIAMLLYILCFIAVIFLGPGADQFVDIPAIALVVFAIYFCISIGFGFKEPLKLLIDITSTNLNKEEKALHSSACKCGIYSAIIVAATIFFIGLVQILQGMHDPAILGPGLATALLSPLYALLLIGVIMLPLKFHYSK